MTRLEAITAQKNPMIRARLEAMTDEQYREHRAKLEVSMGKVAARLANEAFR